MKKSSGIINFLTGKGWYISTAISCFAPVLFFLPVICTVYEIKYNTNQNKTILYSATAALIFSLFMGGYILWGSFVGNLGTYALAFAYIPALIISAYLFCAYIPLSKRAKLFSRCILLIQQEHITSISQISEIIGISETKTVSVLKQLIKMGELDGADVNNTNDEIIFKKSIWARQKFTCKSCGANLVVNLGHTLICEYCNGALETQNK